MFLQQTLHQLSPSLDLELLSFTKGCFLRLGSLEINSEVETVCGKFTMEGSWKSHLEGSEKNKIVKSWKLVTNSVIVKT